VFLLVLSPSRLDDQTEVSTQEDATLVEHFQSICDFILVRPYPADIDQTCQAGRQDDHDLKDSIVFKCKNCSNEDDSAEQEDEMEAQSRLRVGLQINS
jgi:hypothetical protein